MSQHNVPPRMTKFKDEDANFIQQLSKEIGCYYHKANEYTYSLKKYDSEIHGEMGVFAWVHKHLEDHFWITTRKDWAIESNVEILADGAAPGLIFISKNDTEGRGTGVWFNIMQSTGEGHKRTVKALSEICKM